MRCRATMSYARVLSSRVSGKAIGMLWSQQANVRATKRYRVGDDKAAWAARFASTLGCADRKQVRRDKLVGTPKALGQSPF